MKALVIANRDTTKDNSPSHAKWRTIIELCLVTFFISLIFDLIGKPIPTSFTDVYEPILIALGVSLYAYAKIRNIEVDVSDN